MNDRVRDYIDYIRHEVGAGNVPLEEVLSLLRRPATKVRHTDCDGDQVNIEYFTMDSDNPLDHVAHITVTDAVTERSNTCMIDQETMQRIIALFQTGEI